MTRRVLLLVASLLAIGFVAGRSTSAQISQDPSTRRGILTLAQPTILTGSDVGFQVVRMDGQIPVGHIVVRINGVWVAADTSR